MVTPFKGALLSSSTIPATVVLKLLLSPDELVGDDVLSFWQLKIKIIATEI